MVACKRTLAIGTSGNWNLAHALIHHLCKPEQRCIHLWGGGHTHTYFSISHKDPKWIVSKPDSNTDWIYPNLLELPRSLSLNLPHSPSYPTSLHCLLIQGFRRLSFMHVSSLESGTRLLPVPPKVPKDQFGLFHVFPKLMGFLSHVM